MVITSQCHQNILFQIRKVVTRIFKTNNCAHHFTEQGKVAEAVDDETEHWPIPPCLREELNKIKFEYRAVPLPVYVNEFFVEPAHVNNCIKGALVELHFELHHFAIRKKTQDSLWRSLQPYTWLRQMCEVVECVGLSKAHNTRPEGTRS